jgi:hypothetical protein
VVEAVYGHPWVVGLTNLASGYIVRYLIWVVLFVFYFSNREEFTDGSGIAVRLVDTHPDAAVVADNLTLLRSALNNRLNFELGETRSS